MDVSATIVRFAESTIKTILTYKQFHLACWRPASSAESTIQQILQIHTWNSIEAQSKQEY